MTDVIRPPAAGRERTAPTRGPDPPLAAIVGVVLRHLGILFFVPLITFALTVWVVISGREYYAQSRLSPQAQQSDASGLASLAATFGMGLPSARSNESLDFYADLLKSREILDSVAMTSFRFAAGPTESDTLSGTYLDLYEINGPNLNARLTRARGRLARDISATVRRPAGVVTLRTTAKWPRLAEQVNRRLLDLVNQFNTHRRQSQAGAERRFLEGRLDTARQELDEARNENRRFLEKNRVWQGDPRLSFEMQQLNQQVLLRQQVFETMAQSYEKARVDEVRNTPVITVVEAPEGSRRREGGLTIAGMTALAVGGVLALGIALALEYAARERALNPEAYDALRRTWRSGIGRWLP